MKTLIDLIYKHRRLSNKLRVKNVRSDEAIDIVDDILQVEQELYKIATKLYKNYKEIEKCVYIGSWKNFVINSDKDKEGEV